MCEVLPLCASPHRIFLSAWMVSFQKGMQSLTTVVSSFKKFRWAVPLGRGTSTGGRPIVVGYDILWLVFSSFAFACMDVTFLSLVVHPYLAHVTILFIIAIVVMGGGSIIHIVVLYSILYWYRDMPFRLIGAKVKFMVEVIPMITAAALHHLLEFNYKHLALLLGSTTYFYTYLHFLHIAYDIRGVDVLLGLGMEVLAYMLNVELLVRALALSFCVGLSFYRYMTYCAPELPSHRKKELEQLPC